MAAWRRPDPTRVGVRISPPTDFVRFNPIPHDSRAKPHDTRTILYDSAARTRDFNPKLNDMRSVIFAICGVIS
jgi:hypothetical protein